MSLIQPSPGPSRVAVVLLLLSCSSAFADGETGVLEGGVLLPDGKPAVDTRVTLVEANRSVFVDDHGRFRFEDVAWGDYHLQAVNPRFGSDVQEIAIFAPLTTLELRLNLSRHREQIVVTATRSARGTTELAQPATALDSAAINERMQPSLGETLAGEAGVSSSYYGPGSSRPVIRGQTAARVRVLEDGYDVGDASATSPDHAVAVDPLSAEGMEILRGPATLLYGSGAIGGLVNVLDQRIPEYAPARPVGGRANLRLGSVADERAGSVSLDGGVAQLAWHLDLLARKTDDYAIPGSAVVGEPPPASGRLFNSAIESEGATLGLSWVGKTGFVGGSIKGYSSIYGIPVKFEDDGEGVRIDMTQRRYDLRGGFDTDFGPFTGIRFGAGGTDYEHRELEGDEVGTRFFNDSLEGRFEMTHDGPLSGIVGVQYTRRDLEALGAEAFLPPSKMDNAAIFAFEEIDRGSMRYEVGLRYEYQRVQTDETIAARPECGDPRDREFNAVSGSFGLVWQAGESYSIGASATRGVRPPNSEELYSCGEHLATLSVEIGDPDLDAETSLGLDVSFRKRAGRVTGEINLFANRFSDFIFEFDTGQSDPPGDPDGFPVFRFTQADAEFYGAELSGTVQLYHAGVHDLDLNLLGDLVRAEFRESGEPLPRIPPWSVGIGLGYRGARWYATADLRYVSRATEIAPTETETPGYTMAGGHVGYRVAGKGLVHDVMLRASNLVDQEARNHVSRLVNLVPLPGRDVGLVYRLIF